MKKYLNIQEKLLLNSDVNDIIPAAGIDASHNTMGVLTPDDIHKDTSTIARILINGYCGWPFLDDVTKYSILSKLLKIHDNSAGNITVSEYFDLLTPIFQKIPDNHIGLVLGNSCARSTMGHKRKNVGKNIATKDEKFVIKKEGDVSVIAVSTLSNWTNEQESKFIDASKEIILNSKAVIIDLRGNGGGRDVPLTRIAEYLYGRKTKLCERSYIRTTPEAVIIQSQSPHPNWQDLDKTKDPTVWHDFSKEPNQKFSGITKPVYVLINGGTSSSAEMFITQLNKKHPYMKLVGDNTNGCEAFGWIRSVILPKSRILFRVGNVYRELEQKNFELNGYAPDILVDDGQDAYIVAKSNFESSLVAKNFNNKLSEYNQK